jgi:RNA polymerase sigma-70 factor, ECF subfamily
MNARNPESVLRSVAPDCVFDLLTAIPRNRVRLLAGSFVFRIVVVMSQEKKRTSVNRSGVEDAWQQLRGELRRFLAARLPGSSPAADDLLQDVFLRVQRKAAELPTITNLRAWLFQITRRALIDHQRAHTKRKTEELPETIAAESTDPILERIREKLAPCLRVMIDELPEAYASALRLVELQELPLAKAAKELDISLTALKSRVRRGRERLKNVLLECCQFEVSANGRVLDYWPRNGRGLGHLPRTCCSRNSNPAGKKGRDCS